MGVWPTGCSASSPPKHAWYRDSLGLARALTGNYTGTIEDFKAFVAWSKANAMDEEAQRRKREAWIAELEAGRKPFNAAMLEDLWNE